MPISGVYNIDCLEYMRTLPDNFFQLSICDPPYGIDASNDGRFGKLMNKASAVRKEYKKGDWDKSVPSEVYFKELFRVSENQIIWGVNYYPYNLTGGRIFWDKNVADGYSASRGELAFKSFGISIDYFKYTWSGMRQGDMKNKEHRIHPTQKPVALYKWLLNNYAKQGDKIFDSHMGSQSSRIACYQLGFDYWGCELDEDYFKQGCERFNRETAQTQLFNC